MLNTSPLPSPAFVWSAVFRIRHAVSCTNLLYSRGWLSLYVGGWERPEVLLKSFLSLGLTHTFILHWTRKHWWLTDSKNCWLLLCRHGKQAALSLCALPCGPAQGAEPEPWGVLSASSFAPLAPKPLQCSLLPAPTPSPHSDPAGSTCPMAAWDSPADPQEAPWQTACVVTRVVMWGGRKPRLWGEAGIGVSTCPPSGGGVSARGRAQSWGLPLAFCRVVGLPRAGGRFMGDQAKLGSPSGAGAGQGALGPRQPTLTVRELWGRARWGTRSSQGQSHHPGQGAGPACEGGQGQGQPRGDLGRAWVPHSSHPPGPCWIQLLPRLLLAPVPATQPSPFGSSRPLLKTPLCQEADRKRKGNAWKRFVTRALFPPSAPGHHHPPGFASHKAGAPKN